MTRQQRAASDLYDKCRLRGSLLYPIGYSMSMPGAGQTGRAVGGVYRGHILPRQIVTRPDGQSIDDDPLN